MLSYIGWDSVGNSNWYILAILILYIITYISFKLAFIKESKISEYIGCILLSVFTIVVVFLFMKAGKPSYYYNTMIIFSVGCWYVVFQEKIESILMKNDFQYILTLTIFFMLYCYMYIRRENYGIEGYTVWAILFALLLVFLTMKFRITSSVLDWFGNHVFSIYILQRIPMIILYQFGFIQSHKYMCFIIAFLCTVIFAMIFETFTKNIYTNITKVFERIGKNR